MTARCHWVAAWNSTGPRSASCAANSARPNDEHRRQFIEQLLSIYGTANTKKLPGVHDDLRAFAFKQLPEVLKKQTNNYQNLVSSAARTVHDVLGPRDGVEFLLDRIEHEPAWFHFNNQDGWSQFELDARPVVA